MTNRAKDQTLHLRQTDEEIAELDAIVAKLAREPRFRVLKRRVGRPDAIRAAVQHYIKNPPRIEES